MQQGTGTNLHYDHPKSKYIRFPCDRIGSFENLWRGPRRGVFICLCYRVHFADYRRELEIRQTSVAVMTDENIGLVKGCR